MKLKVVLGKSLYLADEYGNALPGQFKTELGCVTDKLAIVTVTFLVDGQEIELVPSVPLPGN